MLPITVRTVRFSAALAAVFALGAPLAPASSLAAGALSDVTAPLEIVVERDASRTTAAKQLARLYAENRDWNNAWRVLERSAPHATKDAEYQGFAGTVLRELKRAPEAVDRYRSATRLQPDDGRWWAGLGLALEESGRRREAREAFAAAAERSHSLPPALKKLVERRSR